MAIPKMQLPRGHQRAITYPATHPMQNQFGGKQEQVYLAAAYEFAANRSGTPSAQQGNAAQYDTGLRRPSDALMTDGPRRPETPCVSDASRIDTLLEKFKDDLGLICSDSVLKVRKHPQEAFNQIKVLRDTFEGLVGESEAVMHSISNFPRNE
ncbi:hypothetical protein V499_01300 [Pseudogymnoascus sp. VKM F-103]|nr:hypothetical protein V499_01300 [Pseudogymnoascus sp. VKM F-103]